jgi:hypothetical protein
MGSTWPIRAHPVCFGIINLEPGRLGIDGVADHGFPANVNFVLNPGLTPGFPGWLHWLRLPLQPVLIWWAYQYR